MRGNNNRIVKKANRFLVLDTIRTFEPMTQDDLVSKTKLSYPTVRNIVGELLDEDIIEKAGLAQSDGGRQPTLFHLNGSSVYSLGIDMAVPFIRCAISDLRGKIVYNDTSYIDTSLSQEDVLDHLVGIVNAAISEMKLPKEKITGLGIGLPGIVDITNGVSVFIERLDSWRTVVPVSKALSERLGIPVSIRNDVHLLGLVEQTLHIKQNVKNFVYIALRSGIGMAIYVDGELFEGNWGNAGYIGHMKVDLNGVKCVCGNTGCLETFVNGVNLINEYKALRRERGLPADVDLNHSDYLSAIIEKAQNDDTQALAVLEKSGNAFGIGIANVIKLLDCFNVIVGGLPEGSDKQYLPIITKAVKSNLTDYMMKEVVITPGKLDYSMAALGGCLLSINQFFMEPKLKLSV